MKPTAGHNSRGWRRFGRWLLVVALLALPAVGRAELRYSGSSTIAIALIDAGGVAAFESKSGKKFRSIEILSSGKGIKALLDGRASIAGCSRALRPEEKKKGLSAVTIGYDAVGIYVNATNPVKRLTMEQLRGIFRGRITNWREVGGKDAPILPITGMPTAGRGSTDFFQERVMRGAPFGRNKEVGLPRDQAIELARHENAITYVSTGLVKVVGDDVHSRMKLVAVDRTLPTEHNVRSGAYPITRPLLLVTRGKARGDEKEFIDFILSRGGQAIIEENFTSVIKFHE